MAHYIRKNLEKGEKIVFRGRLHWTYIYKYLFASILGLLLAIAAGVGAYLSEKPVWYYVGGVLLFIALVVYIIGRIIRTRTEFVVTNSRFIQKDGIFNIKMTEIPLFKIETVNFEQTFWQRILGTGSVELVGSGGTFHRVHYIKKPQLVRKTIVSAINQYSTSSASSEKKMD